MPFGFASKEEASIEARAAGVDDAFVVRDHEGDGSWGWNDPSDYEGKSEDAGEAEAPCKSVTEAQPGDRLLVIGGPILPAMGLLEAVRIAKKLGLQVTILDAVTHEVKDVVTASRAKATKGVRGSSGPSDLQQIIIDLATREAGVSGAELLAAGAGGNAKAGKIAWRQLVEGCQRYGYTMRISSRIECRATGKSGKQVEQAVVVYHLDEAQAAAA